MHGHTLAELDVVTGLPQWVKQKEAIGFQGLRDMMK